MLFMILFMYFLGILIVIFIIGFKIIGLYFLVVFLSVNDVVILKVILDELILWYELLYNLVLILIKG